MKTIREVLAEGTSLLKDSAAAAETPFLDAVVLLSFILDISKEKLLASYPDRISQSMQEAYMEILKKRLTNSPVSYLTKRKEFFGLSFYVDENVLVPRPDSETLVETAIDIINRTQNMGNVLDLGTGSGALGIALKYTFPDLNVICSDLSIKSLEVCKKNSKTILGKELETIHSDLFNRITGSFDLIISNPPYLTEEETDNMAGTGWKEPVMALDGGKDGLDIIRKIIDISPDYLKKNSYLLIESGIDQTQEIKDLMELGKFHNTKIIRDLSDRNRVTMGQRV